MESTSENSKGYDLVRSINDAILASGIQDRRSIAIVLATVCHYLDKAAGPQFKQAFDHTFKTLKENNNEKQ